MGITPTIDPPSRVSALALEVARQYLTPALLNHSIRSYAWAVDHADRNRIAFDAELLYVSALLHDLGLVPEFDSENVAFEKAGGHVAWAFAAGADWTIERRNELYKIIVSHMTDDEVEPGSESELLRVATSLDISGRNAHHWNPETVNDVLGKVPRLDLGAQFIRCFEAQSRRKPTSAAASAMRSGIVDLIRANPLDDQHS
ncbi:cyanamide hydratase [Cryobacterium zongtaii]|uniref:Cyanamide hydratase n=1 Tax=Cryobacterium zongtaii TaxID=1259217 RepID=A0A2S3Z5V6_9MICO|nr:HD domain-containing protein [Cryobacterium zongtaii]POH59606.1 cyanamide hydratase [Cryobacterium zongtaii]POH62305.1 cyanamide hydratase [Cryobacterium zongtaii]